MGLVLEAEDRRLSVRMNRTMYRFGIITGIFLPMSFLTGLLGINVGDSVLLQPLWIHGCVPVNGLGGARTMVAFSTTALGLS